MYNYRLRTSKSALQSLHIKFSFHLTFTLLCQRFTYQTTYYLFQLYRHNAFHLLQRCCSICFTAPRKNFNGIVFPNDRLVLYKGEESQARLALRYAMPSSISLRNAWKVNQSVVRVYTLKQLSMKCHLFAIGGYEEFCGLTYFYFVYVKIPTNTAHN